MRYGPNLLEEILRRTDIVQLVGRRVKLTRKGQAFWGCCPFHGEKTASFKVENARRTYKCFGCGKGGDAFKWLMETEGLSFPEAVEKLAGEAGVELPKWSPDDEAREEKRKSLYDVIELAASFFEAQLHASGGRVARDYLASRALNEETAKKFRLGYAPASGNGLIEHLTAKNVTMDDMIAAGLARPADGERGVRDFFFNRLMFPISDGRGRTVAFGGRGLTADAKPKYINTGETEFFSKGRLLYNFATARPAGIKAQTIIVAEGYMDVIALVRAGFEAAVAPLGTALTEDQLMMLWKVAPEPVMSFDGDEAGLRAAHRAARLALPHLKPGHSLRFAFLPSGEDPDSLIRSMGAGTMARALEQAEPLAHVIWRNQTEGKDISTPERYLGLKADLDRTIQEIKDPDVSRYYAEEFSARLAKLKEAIGGPARPKWTPKPRGRTSNSPVLRGASSALKQSRLVTAIQSAYKPAARATETDTALVALRRSLPPAPPKSSSREGVEAAAWNPGAIKVKETELVKILLEDPEIVQKHAELVAALPFSDPLLDRLRQELLNVAASGSRLEKTGLENHLIRHGMADLVERLKTPRTEMGEGTASGEDADARFLRAARQLRDMAELDPERRRALERFRQEPNEERWLEVRRLLDTRE